MAAAAPVLRERSVRSGVPADTENLLFPPSHGIMQKTEYPGLAQLVARVVWVDRRPIRYPESESPEALGTVVRSGNPPVEKLP